MSPDSDRRYVDGIDHYNNWRNEKRAQALLEAIRGHAVTVRPYGRSIPEQIDMVLNCFDKHFPESK